MLVANNIVIVAALLSCNLHFPLCPCNIFTNILLYHLDLGFCAGSVYMTDNTM